MDPAVQPNPIKNALETMLGLQELDNQIRQLKRKSREMEEHLAATQGAVEKARSSEELLKKNYDNEKKKRGLYELEVKTKEEEILKFNGQLNECKSNEAYSAKLNEIKAAKDSKKDLEEKVLQLMENEEALTTQYKEQAAGLQSQVAAAQQEAAKVAQEVEAFGGQGRALEARKAEALKDLPPTYRDVYVRRQAQRPTVIARLGENQICGACSMKVPPHQVNEIRKFRQFVHCQSCGVILATAGTA